MASSGSDSRLPAFLLTLEIRRCFLDVAHDDAFAGKVGHGRNRLVL